MTTRQLRIAPSILASDFSRLGEECRAVLSAGADWLHFDVMDGHYVPNLTIGLPVLRSLRKALPDAFLDVHLMIDNPDEMAPLFADAGADLVCFHPETSRHPHRTIAEIKRRGARTALALNPGTPLSWLDHLGEYLDMVLIMSVNPGFGGQAFIEATIPKLEALTSKMESLQLCFDVQVDGGIKAENAQKVRHAGANILVAGSAIFGTSDYGEAIRTIRDAAENASNTQ